MSGPPGGGSWLPPERAAGRAPEPVPAGRRAGGSPSSGRTRQPAFEAPGAAGPGVVEGQVRDLNRRSEAMGESASREVWTFRVERFDETGNRVLLVPVEMRGLSFRGVMADGDWVRVRGRSTDGTLRASRVENLSTGASVDARGVPKAAVVVAVVIVSVIVVIFVVIAVVTLGGVRDVIENTPGSIVPTVDNGWQDQPVLPPLPTFSNDRVTPSWPPEEDWPTMPSSVPTGFPTELIPDPPGG